MEPWSSQTEDFKIDTCLFLARHSALLRLGKDWLAQCKDNVIEWDSNAGVTVRQHYKTTVVHRNGNVSGTTLVF